MPVFTSLGRAQDLIIRLVLRIGFHSSGVRTLCKRFRKNYSLPSDESVIRRNINPPTLSYIDSVFPEKLSRNELLEAEKIT